MKKGPGKAILILAFVLLPGPALAGDNSTAILFEMGVDTGGGNVNQEGNLMYFGSASTTQIGYTEEGNVSQIAIYENIESGNIVQWGDVGSMGMSKQSIQSIYLPMVTSEAQLFRYQEGSGVEQTAWIRNSDDVWLQQIIGGLKSLLFPPNGESGGSTSGFPWGGYFCGYGGTPACAKKFAERILSGNATPRDFYMLGVLEEEDVYPPENLTPGIVLTEYEIKKNSDNITIKFRARNFAREKRNATLVAILYPKINLEGIEEKPATEDLRLEEGPPEEKTIELDKFILGRGKGLEKTLEVPLNGFDISRIRLRMITMD